MREALFIVILVLGGCGGEATSSDATAPDAAVAADAAPDSMVVALDALPDAHSVDAPDIDAVIVDAPQVDAELFDAASDDGSASPFACTQDNVSGVSPGIRPIVRSNDLIALCSGDVLIGDRVSNQVLYENVLTGEVHASYQLVSAPGDIDLDEQSQILYVTMAPATLLTRIDLISGASTTFSLPQIVLAAAAGPVGKVYLISDDGSDLFRRLYVIDRATGSLDQDLDAPPYLQTVTFDAPDFQLLAEDGRGLYGTIYHYAIDRNTGLLTLMQGRGAGTNCGELAVSPFGGHLAYPCAATDDYSGIFDLDPSDLATVNGEWIPRTYADRGAAFSPDGSSVAIADATNVIQVFSVQTHVEMDTYNVSTNCPATSLQITHLRYSRGGRLLLAYLTCLQDQTTYIAWFVRP